MFLAPSSSAVVCVRPFGFLNCASLSELFVLQWWWQEHLLSACVDARATTDLLVKEEQLGQRTWLTATDKSSQLPRCDCQNVRNDCQLHVELGILNKKGIPTIDSWHWSWLSWPWLFIAVSPVDLCMFDISTTIRQVLPRMQCWIEGVDLRIWDTLLGGFTQTISRILYWSLSCDQFLQRKPFLTGKQPWYAMVMPSF